MIKLIAFDMDYTLLRTNGELSKETEEVLRKAHEQGIYTVPVTGRCKRELEPFLPRLFAHYIVSVNGALVQDVFEDEILYHETANQELMLKMIKKGLDLGLYVEVYSGDAYTDPYCYEHMEELGMPPEQVPLFQATRIVVPDIVEVMEKKGDIDKLHMIFKSVTDKKNRQHVFLGHPEFSYTAAFINNLELCSNKVNKASGLVALAQHLGIDKDEVMAIGDGANDACMLRWAGLGVAVKNAVPEAKEAADRLTLSNDEDGVAAAIRQYALQ
ncbi:MAG: HAD family phosphatase [Clostridia bacterium]|nr:HAD family phosphatase [Clostridia bacterium]